MDQSPSPGKSLSRRLFFFFGSLLLVYPLIRFILHRVPKKPEILEIHEPLTTGGFLIKNRFIIFSKDGKTWAVSRKCTHLGCKLVYKEEEDILECPCHQSRFTSKGKIIKGPAKRDLATFKTEKQLNPPVFTVTI